MIRRLLTKSPYFYENTRRLFISNLEFQNHPQNNFKKPLISTPVGASSHARPNKYHLQG